MSTKPTPASLCDWDTNATNTSAPTSGHVTDGYATDEVPASAEFNEELRRLGLVAHYVLDGDMDVNSLKVETTAEVVGNTTLDGALEVKGATTFDASSTVTFSGPVYDVNLRQHGISYTEGTVTGAATTTPVVLQSSGAWEWTSPYFGEGGELLISVAVAVAAASTADTMTYSVWRVDFNQASGAVTETEVAGGTEAVTGGVTQYLSVTLPGESTSYEPLGISSYYIQLSGSASGVQLRGGLRYATKRPASAT